MDEDICNMKGNKKSLDMTRAPLKTTPTFLPRRGNVLTELLNRATLQGYVDRRTDSALIKHGRHRK